jgi:acyl-CoA synthetase (AMP-forming)/AMP-acid ligase II
MDATLEDSLLGALPSNPALIEPDEGLVMTYEQLHGLVELVARQLVTVGVRPCTRVVIRARNGPEVIVAFLAIAKAGAVAIPVNPALKPTELATVFAALKPDIALVDAHDGEGARVVGEADAGLEQLALNRLPDLRLDGVSPSSGAPEGGKPDDVCLMLQTSGTTSRPKTVPLRHRNLKLELDPLTSAVIELAGLAGVDVPSLQTLHAATDLMAPKHGVR